MSNQYGPRIVTDGLVLHLDAANRKSYPLSGDTWYDLSGNGNNATMVGTTSEILFNTNNSGYFNANVSSGITGFDIGSNSNFNLGNNGPHSVSSFIRTGSSNNSDTILAKSLGINSGSPYTWLHVVRDGGRICTYRMLNGVGQWYGRTSDSVTNPQSFTAGQWGFVTYSYDGSVLKWYYNGALVNSTSFSYTDQNTHKLYTVASWTSTHYFTGDISCVSFYNKGLSSNEVQQNYNALKGRFGL